MKKIKHFILILVTSWMLGIANILRDEEKMVADFFEREPIVEIYNSPNTFDFADYNEQAYYFAK